MKTTLAIIGLIAVALVGYTFINGKKPEFVQKTESKIVKESDKGTDIKTPEKTEAKKDKKHKTPLDWEMTQILKDPVTYFEYAINDAQKKYNEIRAKEAELRVKQKELARKVSEKKKSAQGSKALLDKAVSAYKTANEKYASDAQNWVCDFPYEGARTKKAKMNRLIVKIKKRAEQNQLIADRTNGVNVQYENIILVSEEKAFQLEMALETLKSNYELAKSTETLDQINFDKEAIAKYVDMSDVYQEMDGGEKALEALSAGQAVQSGYDEELAALGL